MIAVNKNMFSAKALYFLTIFVAFTASSAELANHKAFQNELTVEINSKTKTLKRSVTLYHYGTRGNKSDRGKLTFNQDEAIDLRRGDTNTDLDYQTPVELNPPEAIQYFKDMSSLFEASPMKWSIGPGLYAATDPIQSAAYAGNPYFLLEITAPAGMKYLDIRSTGALTVSKAFAKKWFLDENNEPDPSQINNIYAISENEYAIAFKILLKNEITRSLVINAIKKLRIDSILYSWGTPSTSICLTNANNMKSAFNFVNPNFLNQGVKLKTFVSQLESNSTESKRNEYLRVFKKFDSGQLKVWQSKSASLFSFNLSKILDQLLLQKWSTSLNAISYQFSSFLDDLQIEKTIGFFNSNSSEIDKYLEVKLNASLYQKIDDEDPQLNQWGNYYLFDPLEFLKIKNPDEYQKRVDLIENETFGCSKDSKFSEENL